MNSDFIFLVQLLNLTVSPFQLLIAKQSLTCLSDVCAVPKE